MIGEVLLEASILFGACLILHIAIWRLRRPETYRVWLPLLVGIFFVAGPLTAAWFTRTQSGMDFLAVLVLHSACSAVYVVGYTLVSAFSPSIEILKLLDRHRGGLRRDEIQLPYLDAAVGGNRVVSLLGDGLIRSSGDCVALGANGRALAILVLTYRHAIGLPDGGGG